MVSEDGSIVSFLQKTILQSECDSSQNILACVIWISVSCLVEILYLFIFYFYIFPFELDSVIVSIFTKHFCSNSNLFGRERKYVIIFIITSPFAVL